MASIKLKHASGNSTILNSPAANSSADVTLKLPSTTGSAGQGFQVASANHSSTNAELEFGTVSSDYVKLQQNTGSSSVSELNFDNLDVTTYKHFDFIGAICPVNDAVSLRFRFRTGGSSGSNVTSAVYGNGFDVQYPDNNEQNTSGDGATKVIMTTGIGNNTGEGIYLNARISFAESGDGTHTRYLMNTITYSGMYVNNQNAHRFVFGGGNTKTGTTYPTGFGFHFESGNVASYSYVLYGVKD